MGISTIDMKYRELNCGVFDISDTPEASSLLSDCTLNSYLVENNKMATYTFKIERYGERTKFMREIGNIKILFHGTQLQNVVGILSRGFIPPKVFSCSELL